MEVKTINGYDIKDETARNQIERTNRNVQFIFPKNFQNAYSGDCNLIIYNNKTIMIDTYKVDQYQEVKNMLSNYDITHLDYVIITHYHSDHVGNFKNLVENNYINSSTRLYFPAEVSRFEEAVEKPGEYQDYCEEHSLTYYVPSEYETLTIDDLVITFFNCNAETLDTLYYDEAAYKNYNNCSTILKVQFKNTQALYTADALSLAMQRVYEEEFIKGIVNLYKVEHHGIETTTNKNLILNIKPQYSYQSSAILDYQEKTLFTKCETTKLLEELNCTNFVMFEQEDYVEFISNGETVNCVSGKPGNVSKLNVNYTYTVNKNATQGTFADGSSTYPFNEINQALGVIKNFPCNTTTINLADGRYGEPDSETESRGRAIVRIGQDTRVVINGNSEDNSAVIINGLYIQDSNVELNNLTIDLDTYDGLMTYNSKVLLNNVIVTSSTSTISTTKSCIIARENSRITLKDVSIDYGNDGIIATDSDLIIDNLTVGENFNGTKFRVNETNMVSTDNITFDSNSDKLANNFNRKIINTPQLIHSTASYTDITLSKSLTNFDWIEIIYADDGANFNSTGKIYNANNHKIPISMDLMGTDGKLYKKCAYLDCNGTSIGISRNRQITYNTDGTFTISDTGNYLRVMKVIGGFTDYINLV